MNQKLHLPIFPLTVFLLPEGISRLRIFEPRYLKMISIASQGQGFVIWFNDNKEHTPTVMWGSWVKIIDFHQDKVGVLEVDVKCESLVEVTSFNADTDKLHFGNVTYLEHWPKKKAEPPIDELSKSLSKVFKNNSILNELYSEKRIDDPTWVVSRWLELLPIHQEAKNAFIFKHSYEQAKDLVQSIIHK